MQELSIQVFEAVAARGSWSTGGSKSGGLPVEAYPFIEQFIERLESNF